MNSVAKVDIRKHARVNAKLWAKFFREQNGIILPTDEEMEKWFELAMVSMGEFLTRGTLANGDHTIFLLPASEGRENGRRLQS